MKTRSLLGKRFRKKGISNRTRNITISAIKEMPILASKVPGTVSLAQGIPSFQTPEYIRSGLIELLRTNLDIGKYSLQPGMPELRRAVADELYKTRGIKADPDREIYISTGAMEALACGILAVIERGDRVIVPSPTYSSHIEQIKLAEGRPVYTPLKEEGGWKLDAENLRKKAKKKPRAMVICNPSNPTGTVYEEGELREIAETALENDILVIADETYDFLIYGDKQYFSLLSIPEMRKNVIGCFSFSKKYAMTGYRVGYMYAPESIMDHVLKVHDAATICAPTISQYAALIALSQESDEVKGFKKAFESRRDLICRRLDAMPDVFEYQKPEGAYYVFPRIRIPDADSYSFALQLLYDAKVQTVPGAAFGPTGEGHLRMSFAGSEDVINEAFDRMERYFRSDKIQKYQ